MFYLDDHVHKISSNVSNNYWNRAWEPGAWKANTYTSLDNVLTPWMAVSQLTRQILFCKMYDL